MNEELEQIKKKIREKEKQLNLKKSKLYKLLAEIKEPEPGEDVQVVSDEERELRNEVERVRKEIRELRDKRNSLQKNQNL